MISFFISQALKNRGSWLLGGQKVSGKEVAILICWTLPHLCAFSELQSRDVLPLKHWNSVFCRTRRLFNEVPTGPFCHSGVMLCASPMKWGWGILSVALGSTVGLSVLVPFSLRGLASPSQLFQVWPSPSKQSYAECLGLKPSTRYRLTLRNENSG